MVVASIALFVALGGTGIAAVNYARNAGKVDGKDAVKAGVTTEKAGGNVVATRKKGPNRGRIPARFIEGQAHADTIARHAEVADNLPGAPATIATIDGVGTFTATCRDQNRNAGREDPVSVISFNAASVVNTARRVGVNDGQVTLQPAGTAQSVTINNSNTFSFHVQAADGRVVRFDGTVRQDGRNTAAAACVVYATMLRFRGV